jgi:hypothetical protein
MFDHYNGIGARRDGCARHDFDGLARPDVSIESAAGTRLADDARAARHLRRADGKTIADRAVERRVVAIRRDVLSEYAPSALLE